MCFWDENCENCTLIYHNSVEKERERAKHRWRNNFLFSFVTRESSAERRIFVYFAAVIIIKCRVIDRNYDGEAKSCYSDFNFISVLFFLPNTLAHTVCSCNTISDSHSDKRTIRLCCCYQFVLFSSHHNTQKYPQFFTFHRSFFSLWMAGSFLLIFFFLVVDFHHISFIFIFIFNSDFKQQQQKQKNPSR